jgi:predicted phage tail protein
VLLVIAAAVIIVVLRDSRSKDQAAIKNTRTLRKLYREAVEEMAHKLVQANDIAHTYASYLEEMTQNLTAAKQKEQEMYDKQASDFADLGRTLNDAFEQQAQTVAALRDEKDELNDAFEQQAQTVAALRDEKDEAISLAEFFLAN